MNYPAAMPVISLVGGALGIFHLISGDVLFGGLCHLISAGLGGYAATLSDSRRLGKRWFQPAVAFCIPFLGGFTAFILSESVKRKKTGRLSEEFAVYLNDAASFRESVPVTDASTPDVESLVPLGDILVNPVSEAEQRIAVENLASMETQDAMEILRRVIDSNSGEGRFFAMTAIGQMEDKLLAKLQSLEARLSSDRDAECGLMLEAAHAYIDFSYYELAQDARRREYLERAGELLEMAVRDDACSAEAWLVLGRVRLMQYDAVRALDGFNAYLKKRPDSQAGLLWRAEAWYAQGDYDRVRDDCRQACRMGGIPGNVRGSVEFWLAGQDLEDPAVEENREIEE